MIDESNLSPEWQQQVVKETMIAGCPKKDKFTSETLNAGNGQCYIQPSCANSRALRAGGVRDQPQDIPHYKPMKEDLCRKWEEGWFYISGSSAKRNVCPDSRLNFAFALSHFFFFVKERWNMSKTS